MAGQGARRESTFVVRLWCEARPSDLPEQWRGTARHCGTGETFGFVSLGQLVRFLERESGMSADDRI
jgi:hypothetical protein